MINFASEMKEKFLSHLKLLVPDYQGAHFLLAVSGGRDSSVLAFLFHQLGLNFAIVHCNFHLREGESDYEMNFVKQMSIIYSVDFYVKEFLKADFEIYKGQSIEMAARELRYKWFNELLKDADFLATAHHANDNVETLLLRLCRGTGLKGLTGIKPIFGKIIRPLLPFTGSEIDSFVQEHHIQYCIDSSNLSDKFQRNKIRLNSIPTFDEINPEFVQTMNHNIDVFNQQYAFYQYYIQQCKQHIVTKDEYNITIAIPQLIASNHAQLLLFEILNEFGFHKETIDDVFHSLEKNSGKKFISPTHILVLDRDKLLIRENLQAEEEEIILPNIAAAAAHGINIELLTDFSLDDIDKSSNTIYVDYEKLTFPLLLRHWHKGDYFEPFGMKGKKKLSDFFTDMKIDNFSKNRIMLLCSGEKIVWIVGYRADNRFRLTQKKNFKCYKIIKT
ncbi:MAG: tRNA lysidine(34) synthetase TilS [Bacteroidales bacterium]|jgi:tRNA(Ile)-lysidine synthase|nr:tRNA lysidine(34) synthetase TilS [Bacteroidales bacterium]